MEGSAYLLSHPARSGEVEKQASTGRLVSKHTGIAEFVGWGFRTGEA